MNLLAPPQPVLLQYLSPDGTPKQTAVQYIQVLRPLSMIPPQTYLKPQPLPTPSDISIEAKPIQKATIPLVQSAYKKSKPSTSLIGAHSYSYPVTSQPREISLNMNEYMPAASSRVSTTVLSPWSKKLMPLNHFQMMTQRA